MIKRMAALPALGLAVSGCVTNLAAVKDDTSLPPVGLPYQLPRTIVTANMVWMLEKCPIVTVVTDTAGTVKSVTDEADNNLRVMSDGVLRAASGDAGRMPTMQEVMLAKTEALFKPIGSLTVETVGDDDTYSIDYETLTSGTKTGAIKVEYHENTLMLKSINAKVDGKEAEALKSAFSLAGNVARITMGGPALVAGAAKFDSNDKVETFSACNDETRSFLAKKLALAEEIKKIETDAARIKAEYTVLAAQLINGAPSAPRQLDKLQADALALQRRLDATKAALTSVNQWLSVEASVRLGLQHKYDEELVPQKTKVEALRSRIASDQCRSQAGCFNVETMMEDFNLNAALRDTQGKTGCIPLPQEQLSDNKRCQLPTRSSRHPDSPPRTRTGLVIRQPVTATLAITQTIGGKTIFEKNLMVAQFGVLRTLPLRNGFGESNTLAATFDKNGMPTMIEYTKPRSGTVELLDALDEGAQTLLAIQADRRAAEKAATDAEIASAKNELEALQRQRDMIKVQAEIDALERATPTENETLKAEIATLELLKQIAQLKQAIRAAAPPPD